MREKEKQQGFTLVEMAVVLVIVALLIGGLMLPLSAQQEIKAEWETKQQLLKAEETLAGFAALYGRLPCPASAASMGQEDCAGTSGHGGYYGFLPAAKLGLFPGNDQGLALDGWNNPLRYAVSNANFGGISSGVFVTANGLKTATLPALASYIDSHALLSVCADNGTLSNPGTINASCTGSGKLTDSAVAVLYSTGKNTPRGGTDSDERHNPNGNTSIANDPAFVHHEPTAAGSAAGEFDDILIWLSPNSIVSKMIAAGTL